ncbi:hypothetical protein P7L53_15250 [Thermoleptolyngbya sichuanensis XZ-Cy5]|uniref:hypothetical protein n=1 Tax=Thermoleptolyngbya TaxID=2303528 RepID=UPI001964A4EA|nr:MULTISPECIES: hypothetical protein [Thermoleptolyngbya]MDG2617597.1 hypothetical protein [Thermoleptolyngbya sichuanensis XZ-Cy5]
MSVFRQYIAPLLVVLMFVLALVVVSARIFLPEDMAAPAPIEAVEQVGLGGSDDVADLGTASSLDVLIHGLPDEAAIAPAS